MATATTEDKPKKGTRKKVPPADDPKPSEAADSAPAPEPRENTGNAELYFNGEACQIGGAIQTLATAGGVRLIRFPLKATKISGSPLCDGTAGAASELEEAAGLTEEGTYTNSLTVGRDFKTQRYVIDPDGSGKGVEFLGSIAGALSVNVSRAGKISASWKVETKVSIEDFDRLCELASLPLKLTTHEIQGEIVEGEGGQLKIH